MKVYKKNQIFKEEDVLEKEFVLLPEWGDGKGGLFVREMTGRERDIYDSSLFQEIADGTRKLNTSNMRAKLVAACACDENGKLVFDFSDVKLLGEKSSKAMTRLFLAAQKINGIGGEAMEKVVKNLLEGRSENSNTD